MLSLSNTFHPSLALLPLFFSSSLSSLFLLHHRPLSSTSSTCQTQRCPVASHPVRSYSLQIPSSRPYLFRLIPVVMGLVTAQCLDPVQTPSPCPSSRDMSPAVLRLQSRNATRTCNASPMPSLPSSRNVSEKSASETATSIVSTHSLSLFWSIFFCSVYCLSDCLNPFHFGCDRV